MAGRPPLAVGTYGKILFMPLPSGSIAARAKFRDYDGVVRPVLRTGATRAAAERNLKQALTERQTPAGTAGEVTPSTSVRKLAELWFHANLAVDSWSTGTARTYKSVVNAQVNPRLGELRIEEVNAGLVSRTLRAINSQVGAGAAKTTRACLGGMFGLAVEDGALPSNPVRDSGARITRATRKPSPRALSVPETAELLGLFWSSEEAKAKDVPELAEWMLSTGARIGEALALRHGLNLDGEPLLDMDAGTWEINATIVRVTGKGLWVQPRTKTDAGWRRIAVPDDAVDRIRPRGTDGLVFHSDRSTTPLDPNNVSGDLRLLLDSFDCDHCNRTGHLLDERGEFVRGPKNQKLRCDKGPWSWVTSHVFRKTVATRLKEAGWTADQVADHIGHANSSMTQDVYFGRQVVNAAAATALRRSA